MSKRISSKKLADEYTIVPASRLDGGEVFGYQHVKMVEREAFLAGWAARGKADLEIIDGSISKVEIQRKIWALDEQD